MQGWQKLTWIETKLFLREPGVYFGLFFPFAVLFIFGTIYGNTPSSFTGGHGALDLYMPAYIVMLIATNSLFSLPIAIINYRERGVLFRLQATPLRPGVILAAQIGVNFLMTTIGALLLVILGRIFYDVHITLGVLNALPAYILGTLSMFAFGFLLASLIPNARVASFVGITLYLVMLYLCGVFIPLSIFPVTLQHIVQILPLTHVVILFQGLWLGGSWLSYWSNVLALIGILIVCTFISGKLFRWR